MCCALIRGDDKNRHVSICIPSDGDRLDGGGADGEELNGEEGRLISDTCGATNKDQWENNFLRFPGSAKTFAS